MACKMAPLSFVLRLLEALILSLLIRLSWFLFVGQLWNHQQMAARLSSMSWNIYGPHPIQLVAEKSVSHVSPWAVEHLPNPVIFPALFAVYAGSNIIRKILETNGQDSAGLNGNVSLDEKEESDVVDETSRKCVDCDQVFRTKGLLTSDLFAPSLI
jgi:hypothetical protein